MFVLYLYGLEREGKYNCVGDDVSLSVIKRYSEDVCVCLEKGKDTGFESRQDSCVCHAIAVAGLVLREGEKNSPLDPLLLQLSDKGLGFLQTL